MDPGRSLSSNVTSFLGTNLEEILIIVLLKIETCLLKVLLLKIVLQFTKSTEFLIHSLFAFFISRSYGKGIFDVESKLTLRNPVMIFII